MNAKKLGATFAALACLASSTSAFAYGEGDFFARLGMVRIEPTGGSAHLGGALQGATVDVETERGAAFTLGYRFTDKFGVELLAAPQSFKHDINVRAGGDTITRGSVRHLPPTLTLQYYPLGGTDAQVQPYIGAGVNYTRFSSEHLSLEDTSLKLEDGWNAAAQVGVDYQLTSNLALNLAVWYLDIDSTAIVHQGGQEVSRADIDINPIVVMSGISLRF
ncbi:OmpW/AlkL family protein [Halotalea alkalilenta]|uniref:Outer membrane protein OmpW n=1 Tax=Halotalea alkalilenta TaxID=376489 RepID=A0A172YDW6_9GAMM|nr:OmpW family outer membrane protein [Halotalea alkalilenta]ANF57448.1 hypothetical protein A5892_08195 [Halotalea alkalilenta]